ncbi:hypothetical protein ACQY1Q_10745 [Tenacibaculum sp. TC6]|uniref:hypothetical protein n=1 Tax=Tenacibaculum sp. TC6 TaxID=3423223 RepID=UPI003D36F63B
MKKVVVILGVVFTVGLLSSCTDNSLDDIENNEKQQIQLIDKDDVETPTTKG